MKHLQRVIFHAQRHVKLTLHFEHSFLLAYPLTQAVQTFVFDGSEQDGSQIDVRIEHITPFIQMQEHILNNVFGIAFGQDIFTRKTDSA